MAASPVQVDGSCSVYASSMSWRMAASRSSTLKAADVVSPIRSNVAPIMMAQLRRPIAYLKPHRANLCSAMIRVVILWMIVIVVSSLRFPFALFKASSSCKTKFMWMIVLCMLKRILVVPSLCVLSHICS